MDPLLARYDTDQNGIERAEVFAAINDYLEEVRMHLLGLTCSSS